MYHYHQIRCTIQVELHPKIKINKYTDDAKPSLRTPRVPVASYRWLANHTTHAHAYAAMPSCRWVVVALALGLSLGLGPGDHLASCRAADAPAAAKYASGANADAGAGAGAPALADLLAVDVRALVKAARGDAAVLGKLKRLGAKLAKGAARAAAQGGGKRGAGAGGRGGSKKSKKRGKKEKSKARPAKKANKPKKTKKPTKEKGQAGKAGTSRKGAKEEGRGRAKGGKKKAARATAGVVDHAADDLMMKALSLLEMGDYEEASLVWDNVVTTAKPHWCVPPAPSSPPPRAETRNVRGNSHAPTHPYSTHLPLPGKIS